MPIPGKRYKAIKENVRIRVLRTYLAGRFDEKHVYILTSSPRSGSTLLGQVLGAIPDSCVLFEPLNLEHVPEAEAAGFSWRTFVMPEEDWREGEAFLKRVFEGRVLNTWTAREMSVRDAFGSRRMIVKCVRANRLLPWICNTFDVPPPVLLLRHPCAVIASQLKSGWKNAQRPETPRYLDQYPRFQSALSETEGDEEHLAALWALDQLPPLLQHTPHPWTIVTYEELILRPEPTLTRIFERWNLDVDMDDALSQIRKPSSVVNKFGISGINGWKKSLTSRQIDQVLSTVNAFGLTFYGSDDEADYDMLHGDQLAEHILKTGAG